MTLKDRLYRMLPYEVVTKRQQRYLETLEPPALTPYDSTPPEIYNKDGQKLHTFFLQDNMTPTYPYSFVYGAMPKYIHWDRFNYGLDVHFYSHHNIAEYKRVTPRKRFAYFIESEAILPNDYQVFEKKPDLLGEYNKIFTHSEWQLNKYENALFCPGGGVWYANPKDGGVDDPKRYKKKTKGVSIISSSKEFCSLHSYRTLLARELRDRKLADAFGTFDGGKPIQKHETLTDYRYSVAVENDIKGYYFTEKILDCFAAMTVPIYLGATRISEFFNPDGIIVIKPDDLENTAKIVAACNEQDYESRKAAIIDNYNRVQKFRVIEDWLFENYKEIII